MITLTSETIDTGRALAQFKMPSGHGAQVTFAGVVRDRNLGRVVSAVSYDAHAALTAQAFDQLAAEACARWGEGLAVAIWHRVGRLAVGETSVLVVVSAAHRAEAYEASRYVIDELKHRAPIWKQEHYIDGDSEWLPGHALCAAHHAEVTL